MHTTPVRIRFDRHFLIRILVGLPVLASLMCLLAAVGWWTQGSPMAYGPTHWLAEPIMLLGWVMIGGIVSFFGLGVTFAVCWTAFAFGSSILDAIGRLQKQVGPNGD